MTVHLALDDKDADLILLALESWNSEGASPDEVTRAHGIMQAIRQERVSRRRPGVPDAPPVSQVGTDPEPEQ